MGYNSLAPLINNYVIYCQCLPTMYVCMYHSVLELIWIKGSYLSQWLPPQGGRGPLKESKSRWIEIFHRGSQFTLWFLKIKIFQKFSDHSKFFFALKYIKNWTKVVPWKKNFVPEKKILSLKKTLKKNLLVGPTVEDFNASWFWLLRGSPFTLW